jgi:hypothetical protein
MFHHPPSCTPVARLCLTTTAHRTHLYGGDIVIRTIEAAARCHTSRKTVPHKPQEGATQATARCRTSHRKVPHNPGKVLKETGRGCSLQIQPKLDSLADRIRENRDVLNANAMKADALKADALKSDALNADALILSKPRYLDVTEDSWLPIFRDIWKVIRCSQKRIRIRKEQPQTSLSHTLAVLHAYTRLHPWNNSH